MKRRGRPVALIVALVGMTACSAITGLDDFAINGGASPDADGGTSTTGGGGGDPLSVCGDSAVGGQEACDDGDAEPGDGCDECAVEPGFQCVGEPSVCTPIEPVVVMLGPGLDLLIPSDESYNGSVATMTCATMDLPDQGFTEVREVTIALGLQHTWVGDLVIKAVSPQGTETTLLSRPGLAEPEDSSTEFSSDGDSANLVPTAPITFRDDATDDAETMGAPLTDNDVVCQDDGRCAYRPSPGAGPGTSLADFQGEAPAGAWKVCVADGNANDSGFISSVELSVLAW